MDAPGSNSLGNLKGLTKEVYADSGKKKSRTDKNVKRGKYSKIKAMMGK